MIGRDYREQAKVYQKITEITESTELGLNDNVVVIGTTTGNITITLPSVGEAAFNFVSIVAPTIATDTNSCTLQDRNDSYDWADKTIDADNDGIVLFSDGRKWWVVTNDIA